MYNCSPPLNCRIFEVVCAHAYKTWNEILGEYPTQISHKQRPSNIFVYYSYDTDTTPPDNDLNIITM